MSLKNVVRIFIVIGFTFKNLVHGNDQNCVIPAPPENGYLISERWGVVRPLDYDPMNFQTVNEYEYLLFKCDSKYKREGEEKIYCHKGSFQYEVPNCVRRYCYDSPPIIENGYYTVNYTTKRAFRKGTKYFVNCTDGYRPNIGSPNFVECQRSGNELSWITGDVPICEEIPNCGDPGTPLNGTRIGDSFSAGETVTYFCDKDDEMIGPETLTCSYDGVWDSPRPRCKPTLSCPDPPIRDHAKYQSINRTKDYFIVGDEVNILCDDGYMIEIGTDRFTCIDEVHVFDSDHGDDGDDWDLVYDEKENVPIWSDEFPQCKEIFCSQPSIPKYGRLRQQLVAFQQDNNTEEIRYKYGQGINYSCMEGYQLIGAHFSECTESGWQPRKPFCRKILCSNPPTPEDGWQGVKTGTGRNIGDIVIFGCSNEYTLSGSVERECLENGQWSGETSICVIDTTHCPNPGTPLHGSKSGINYNLGDHASFMCDAGYTLLGSPIRECLLNRVWSGEEVICKKSTDFDRTPELQYRLLSNLDSMVHVQDSVAQPEEADQPIEIRQLPEDRSHQHFGGRQLIVNPAGGGSVILYFIFDSSRSVGRANFNMSIDFVKALVKRIGVSAKGVRVGAAAFGNQVNIEQSFLPTEFSETADVLRMLEQLKSGFTDGGTNIHEALKFINMQVMNVVRETIKGKITSQVVLLSDGVYNLGGDPTPLAAKMKKEGVTFSCVAVSGAKIDIEALHKIASKRKNVYELKDYDQLSWIVDQVLNDEVDYSRCGLAVKKNQGRAIGEIVKLYWPWMAMLRKRELNTNAFSGFCGGSLIDRDWILTAAHCLFLENGDKRKPDDLVIRLGYTKDDNKTFVQDIPSAKIYLHPEYSKLVNFDYDIALIKLQRSAIYGKRVRPVCLSPAEKDIPNKSTLYTEKTAGWAIGYGTFTNGRSEIKQRFRDLREVALDIGSHQDCEEFLHTSEYKIYTTRMFCAGGVKDKDTCDGDSGGPFMKHQYNADGEGYWIQTGITSFNPFARCGKEGDYGYYTKVSVVRDWIDETMKRN